MQRSKDKKDVEREMETLAKLVRESKSPDRLPAYKEMAWKCRFKCVRSQEKMVDALIADISNRQMEWMGLDLDEDLDNLIRSMQPKQDFNFDKMFSESANAEIKNNLEKVQHGNRKRWRHKKLTHHK